MGKCMGKGLTDTKMDKYLKGLMPMGLNKVKEKYIISIQTEIKKVWLEKIVTQKV